MLIPPLRCASVGMTSWAATSTVGLPEYCLLMLHRDRPFRKDAFGARDTMVALRIQACIRLSNAGIKLIQLLEISANEVCRNSPVCPLWLTARNMQFP
jgi:hypothetical protein